MAADVAENGVLFFSYGRLRNVVGSTVCAGGLAAGLTSLVLCPFELVKCRMQTQHVSARAAIASTLQRDGASGLMRGLTPTLAREIPGYCAFFAAYEHAHGATVHLGNASSAILSGGIGGLAFWSVGLPMDTIKSVVQCGEASSMREAAARIVRSRGLPGFYAGCCPVMLRAFVANSALFLAADSTARFVGATSSLYR